MLTERRLRDWGELVLLILTIFSVAMALLVTPVMYSGIHRVSDLGRAPRTVTTLDGSTKIPTLTEHVETGVQSGATRYVTAIILLVMLGGASIWLHREHVRIRVYVIILFMMLLLLFVQIMGVVVML